MAQKFIINNGNLVVGNVQFHKELITNHSTTRGGGWWHLDRGNGIMYLYNRSIDFGQAQREDVIKAITTGFLPPSLSKLRFFHSYEHDIYEAMKDTNGVWIDVPKNNKTHE